MDYDFIQGGANVNEMKTGCMGNLYEWFRNISSGLTFKCFRYSSWNGRFTTFNLAPCQTVSYDVRASKFNQGPLRVWFPDPEEEAHYNKSSDYEENSDSVTSPTLPSSETSDASNKDQEERDSQNMNESAKVGYSQRRYIYLYYTTADETTLSSEVLIDFAGFISAIGGNLGLFLGFSFMGMIFELYDWIEAKL